MIKEGIMRVFLTVLVLIFSLQSWTKADDIRDFEIEGISIGDSLLDFYSIGEIESIDDNFKVFYKDKTFYDLQLDVKKYEIWPILSFSVKKNDKKYIIHAVAGGNFVKSLKECKQQQDQIVKDLTDTFLVDIKSKKYNFKYEDLADGKSIAYVDDFNLFNGSLRVYCTDWSDQTELETTYTDNIRLEIGTQEYFEWLNNKAYN